METQHTATTIITRQNDENQVNQANNNNHKVLIIAIGGYLSLNLLAFILGSGGVPFDRPLVGSSDDLANILFAQANTILVLILILVAYLISRSFKQGFVDISKNLPGDPQRFKMESLALLVWGGFSLALGYFAFGEGLHLGGTVFGFGESHPHLHIQELVIFSIYNMLMYAVIPYLFFRYYLGYDNKSMLLTGFNNRLNWTMIIIFTLLQVPMDLALSNFVLFTYPADQLVVGLTISLIVQLTGTGIPIMIFVQSLLVPRFYMISRSYLVAILGSGVVYASLHLTEYWTVFNTPLSLVLSILYIFLQFFGPGLVKGYLTLRTGNAWVHVWAYHVLSPHLTIDTPNIIEALYS